VHATVEAMMRTRSSWQSLAEWTVGFALLTLSFLGMLSIGIFVLPVAAGALWLADRRNPFFPTAPFGALMGIGCVCLFIGVRNIGSTPCESHLVVADGVRVHESFARTARAQRISCGGVDPTPWLAIGIAGVGIGLVGNAAAERRSVTRA
jgi:hypothetical protein